MRCWLAFTILMAGTLPYSRAAAAEVARSGTWADSAAASRAATLDQDLRPTSEIPWNPPRPVPRRETWERVVLFPQRVASLPISALGALTERSLLHLEEAGWIAFRPPVEGDSRTPLVRLKPARFGPNAGVGGALDAAIPFPHDRPRLRFDAGYAGTLDHYGQARLGLASGPLAVHYVDTWRPQDRFYGIGPASSKDDRTNFASRDQRVQTDLQWGWNRDSASAPPRTRLDLWAAARSQVTRRGHEDEETSYDARFPALAAGTLDRRLEHLIYGASLAADRRSGFPHWSRGWRMLAAAERYDAPMEALALRSAAARGAQFTRFRVEGEVGRSFRRDPRTVRLLVRLIDQNVSAGDEHFLLADLARLGSADGLAGFGAGRFHDRDLLLTRLSYVFPLVRRFELDLHGEWGSVTPDLWEDLKPSSLEHSFGFALRPRGDRRPLGSIGLEVSRERVRVHFAVGDVE